MATAVQSAPAPVGAVKQACLAHLEAAQQLLAAAIAEAAKAQDYAPMGYLLRIMHIERQMQALQIIAIDLHKDVTVTRAP